MKLTSGATKPTGNRKRNRHLVEWRVSGEKTMNIDKLITAAKKIDALADKAEARAKDWQDLAKDARNPDIASGEIEKRRRNLDASQVVSFDSAISELRAALRAR